MRARIRAHAAKSRTDRALCILDRLPAIHHPACVHMQARLSAEMVAPVVHESTADNRKAATFALASQA